MSDINVTFQPVIVEVSENTYTINMSSVGAQGATGSAGQINSVAATTLAAGSPATVVNNGSTTNAQLVFGIPTGPTGSAATVAAGTATGLSAGSAPTVSNSGSTSAAVFNFGIPAGATGSAGQGFNYRNAWVSGTSYVAYDVVTYSGSTYVCISAVSGTTVPSGDATHWTLTASKGDTGAAATIAAGTTTTGAAGTNATVTNSGSSSAATFDFTIPRGATGAAATIAAGTATGLSAGSAPTVTNSGSSSAATFNFGIPAGATGTAATATAGTTTTGAAGTNASVVNSGSTSAAVFDFTIPRGNTGATGQGFTYRNAWASGTSYSAYNVVTYSGSTYVCILAVSGTTVPSGDASHWTLTTQGYTQKGTYTTGVNYVANDVVYYAGSTYVCISPVINVSPPSATYWQKFALGFTGQGAYVGSTTYYSGDVVSYNGSSYYCLLDSTSGRLPTNTSYWGVLASKGDTGAAGPTGPTGNWDYFAPASGMDIMPRSISTASRSMGNNFMYISWFVALNSFTCSTIQAACSVIGIPASTVVANKEQIGLFQPVDSGGNYSPSAPTNAKCLAISIKSNTGSGMAAFNSLTVPDTFNLGFTVTGTAGSYVTTGTATPISIVAGQTYGVGFVASATNGFTTAASLYGYGTGASGNTLQPYMCGTVTVPSTSGLANDITVNQLFTVSAATGNSSTPWSRLS